VCAGRGVALGEAASVPGGWRVGRVREQREGREGRREMLASHFCCFCSKVVPKEEYQQ
jgi:hypothetical protein